MPCTQGASSFSRPVDIQIFTGNGTWTKPAGAKSVLVQLIGGGAGGGSGRRGAAGTVRGGGSGGAGAGIAEKTFPASVLGATETIIVGTGGTGGAAQTVDNTDGNDGNGGNSTSFGAWLKAPGGTSGKKGTSAAGGAASAAPAGYPDAYVLAGFGGG